MQFWTLRVFFISISFVLSLFPKLLWSGIRFFAREREAKCNYLWVTTWSFKSLALRTQHINRYKSSKVRMAWTTCSPLLTPTSFAFLCHLTLILWQKDDPVRLSSARQVSNQTHFLCHLYMYRVDFVLLWIIDLNAFILGVLA